MDCGATVRIGSWDIPCQKERGHTDEHGNNPFTEWTTTWPNEGPRNYGLSESADGRGHTQP